MSASCYRIALENPPPQVPLNAITKHLKRWYQARSIFSFWCACKLAVLAQKTSDYAQQCGSVLAFRIENGVAGSVKRFQGIRPPPLRKRARVGDDRILGHE